MIGITFVSTFVSNHWQICFNDMCWALSSLLSWMPGWLESISTDIAQSMMCAISRIHNGHNVVFCFRHATPFHYHHDAWLLACVEHNKRLLVISCRGCVEDGISSFDYLFAIYRVTCVELAHSSRGDWKDVPIIHLIIIIESEVSTSPIVVIFFRGCVSEMVVLPYSVIYYIYLGNTETLFQLLIFSLLMFSLWYLQTIGYIMACRSCSFVCRSHHLIIIIMQTYLKALNY